MAKTEKLKGVKQHTVYRTKDGLRVPGVTTILGMLNKPALVRWANKLGLQGIDSSKYVNKLADIGTCAHYMVQCDLAGEKPDLSEFAPQLVDKAENCLLSYYEWRKSHTVEPILVEEPLVHEHLKFGGTVDFYGMIDGEPTLLDLKTGSGIYNNQLVQLAAYRNLLIYHGHMVSRAIILNIPRGEDEGFLTKQISRADMTELWDGFFVHALMIYKANKKWRVV